MNAFLFFDNHRQVPTAPFLASVIVRHSTSMRTVASSSLMLMKNLRHLLVELLRKDGQTARVDVASATLMVDYNPQD